MSERIVIVTSGQPSANPRVVKEAMALSSAGYNVTVVYAPLSPWADVFDEKLFQSTPSVKWVCAAPHPSTSKYFYLYARFRKKIFSICYKYVPFLRQDGINGFVLYAQELKRVAIKIPADLYIGHNLGALKAITSAAKKWKGQCGFDAEDFHRGEEPNGHSQNKMASIIEDYYFPKLDYLTTASPLISAAYKNLFPSLRLKTINNVFSVKYLQTPSKPQSNELRLFWFSQTLGTNRGLEQIIEALNLLPQHDISLHLLGNCTLEFRTALEKLAHKLSMIHFLEPVHPEQVFAIAAKFDVGIASEVPYCDSRNFCLTNKIFTYLLSSLCILASDTLSQVAFLAEHPSVGITFENQNAYEIASQLKILYSDRELLLSYKMAAHQLAKSRLNWEEESRELVQLVETTI